MALIDYTTANNVFAIGDAQNPSTTEQAVMASLVTAVSRQLDSWLNQVFSQQVYTAQVYRAQIDADGLLQCWPACPTMSAPTAIAWKRGFDVTWNDISGASYEIEQTSSGCRLRVISPNLLCFRGTRIQMRLSFTGGWAALANVPSDFEWGARRACWIEYKKRDQADMGKTAIPELGVVVTPGAWPEDIKRTFANYKRVVLI